MDKKRKARKVVLVILAAVFAISVVYYAALLVQMFNDRVYILYQGELYRAHRRLGNGYELPDDATEVGKASYVSDKKDELSDEFDTTLHRDRLTVYVSESNPDRVYLLEEDIFGELDVWIFALD